MSTLKLHTMTVLDMQARQDRQRSLLGELRDKIREIETELAVLGHEIERRTKPAPEPRVSEHARMRFAERVLGIDFNAISNRILTKSVKEAIKAGATGITVEGVYFKVVDGVVVTAMQRDRGRLQKPDQRDIGPSLKEGLQEAAE